MDTHLVSELAKHFFTLMGSNPSHKALAQGWCKSVEQLLTDLNSSPDQLREFMTWATTENTDDNPKFNSVEYLAQSRDPMNTLVKFAPGLYKVWQSRKRSEAAKKAPKVKPFTGWTQQQIDITHWMMTGPGMNQPLKGWTSAREKLDATKSGLLDYRPGWQDIPDPITMERAEELFAHYQAELKNYKLGAYDPEGTK